MKKIVLLSITLTLAVSVFAQNKMLSSKQLMSGSLYPQSSIRGVQFVGSTIRSPTSRILFYTWDSRVRQEPASHLRN